MTDNGSGFCAGLASFLQKYTASHRSFALKTHNPSDNWGKAGIKIVSSVHRPSDPSAGRGAVRRRPDEPMVRCPDRFVFPLCISKQKGLAINSGILAKCYVTENKSVGDFFGRTSEKTRGAKNEGIFHYVIENKWWKNARKQPFHYVDENKYSYIRLSIMLMKINMVIRNGSDA